MYHVIYVPLLPHILLLIRNNFVEMIEEVVHQYIIAEACGAPSR